MFLKLYLIALPIFLIADALWLGLFSRNFYREQIGFLMGEIKWIPAVIFYLLFLGGLVLFVINPAISRGSWLTALGLGALFGLITYATYDLTNQATIKNWPALVTIVDLLWGAFIAAFVSVTTYFIYNN